MQPPGIPTKTEDVNWDYDQEADVLYISVDEPVEALGLDIGEGVIVRYSEERGEVCRTDNYRHQGKEPSRPATRGMTAWLHRASCLHTAPRVVEVAACYREGHTRRTLPPTPQAKVDGREIG